jgi:hypothetical protein
LFLRCHFAKEWDTKKLEHVAEEDGPDIRVSVVPGIEAVEILDGLLVGVWEESGHSPENGATTGWLHAPSDCMWYSTMMLQFAACRVKKIVLPSGEKVGAPSLAGPETTPGAKICGSGRVITAKA